MKIPRNRFTRKETPKPPDISGIGLPTRLLARKMFVWEQRNFDVVAERTGLTEKQVRELARVEGWSAPKRARGALMEAVAAKEREVIARSTKEVVEAVAQRGEYLAVRTLDRAVEIVDAEPHPDQAKDLQSISAAAKNFNTIFREARGLDRDEGEQSRMAPMVALGMFVLSSPPEPAATPAAAAATTEPINVTPSATPSAPEPVEEVVG